MARRDDRDDDDGTPLWLLLLLLIFLMVAGFFLWRWWSAPTAADDPVPVVEDVIEAPDEPEPMTAPDPEPIDDTFSAEADLAETFEAPPPIEELPPPPPQEISFTVYFELMRAELTSQARADMRARIGDVELSAATQIEIDGHTDTAGTDAYNEPLSRNRAMTVQQFLVQNGAPTRIVEAEWFGETRLAKVTQNGVREPLNRRAEITISFD